MSDLSKRRPQIDFCAGWRAHKRGDPREGCSAAWHEGWDAHAELAAERERADRLAAENNELNIELAKWVHYWRDKDNKALAEKVAKLREALAPFAKAAANFETMPVKDPEGWYAYSGESSATGVKGAITVGDLRRARAVLEETAD